MSSFSSIAYCPILRPTPAEFQDFNAFMEQAEAKYSAEFGMVKIVPPKSEKFSSHKIQDIIDKLTIINPYEQNVYGKGGIYESLLIVQKSLPLKDYKKKVQSVEDLS